jgi:hypothetical protein
VKHFFPLSTLFGRTCRSVEFTSTRLLDPALTLRFCSLCLLHFGYIFKFIIMHPESYAARKGLSGIGHVHGRHFKHTIVHEGCEIGIASDMPDRDTFNLSLKFLDLEGKKHSVTDNSSLNLCFPPEYKPITGPYVSQSTNLSEQMAGTKRSQKGENAYILTAKRRVVHGGRDLNDSSGTLHLFPNPNYQYISVAFFEPRINFTELLFSNHSTATALSRSAAREGDTGTRKPVIIDLSGDEEHSDTIQSVKAIMKRLPPDSITGDFPRFKGGTVYIIIDSKSSIYQYRLHKATLSRVSPMFAKFIQLPCPEEAMEELKVAATDAQARFELTYSSKHGKWILRRAVS